MKHSYIVHEVYKNEQGRLYVNKSHYEGGLYSPVANPDKMKAKGFIIENDDWVYPMPIDILNRKNENIEEGDDVILRNDPISGDNSFDVDAIYIKEVFKGGFTAHVLERMKHKKK